VAGNKRGSTKSPKRGGSQAPAKDAKSNGRARGAGKSRAATKAVESVNITPTPRILKILGNIEFEPWQCVAELVDNCFDEFLSIKRSGISWNEPSQVSVSLPATSVSQEEATIVVSDNGRGMTLSQVTQAAKAGWTSNDPFTNLGLFGMGFNVATARLGQVTRILTSRSGDSEWVGLEIDLDTIGPDFTVPVVRRPKASPGEHGTRVEISALDARADWLRRSPNQRKLRETLGGVYSYLLDDQDFTLLVNDVLVKPIRHCVWSDKRTVVRAKETIPAVLPIDKPLADRAVCHVCGTWQDIDNERCDECDSDQLEARERRIHGWVGIQRYLDPKEFGIDFLRNGRKIRRFDKSLFQWRDPDDPSGQGDTEYPIELPANQGRIVGEIHLDHVPVQYTKDAFDTSDKGWRDAVRAIRGDGPLLPQAARRLGMENNSPLARLHRGFRRNDPGKNYLTPGNGKMLIDTREWGRKFRDGNPEYQEDTKWWEAVVRHDELVAEAKRAKERGDRAAADKLEDPAEEFRGDGAEPSETAEPTDGSPAEPQTDRERADALLKGAQVMAELDGQFSAAGVAGRPVKLTAYEVTASQVKTPEGKRTPVWLAPQRGGSFAAFVDMNHAHFAEFDDDPADMVIMELAQHLIARSQGAAPPISTVFAGLKERYLASRTIDQAKLVAMATQLMRDLKERMVACVSENPERPWKNALNDAERHLTGDRIIDVLKTADTDSAVLDGRYLAFIPDGVLPRIVEEWPEAFFDDRLFRGPYVEVSSSSARRQTVSTVTGYLNDVAWLAQAPQTSSREQLIRSRLSLQLLPDEITEIEE
jgi:Histidine kinase-, DNA gyrase B-, and HSP90-like ATPase